MKPIPYSLLRTMVAEPGPRLTVGWPHFSFAFNAALLIDSRDGAEDVSGTRRPHSTGRKTLLQTMAVLLYHQPP